MADCTLCPRKCHANRREGETGFCGQTASLRAARAALHDWEEPCISGANGSGAVFLGGCNLGCIFCQNYDIALGQTGKELSVTRLSEIFLELQDKGAHNINLVTPTHFIPQICLALDAAKKQGLTLPIVYNTGSYEEVSSLQLLDGLIDIYLPDFKYYSAQNAIRFAHAHDYFEKATLALEEMYRQVGKPLFDQTSGLMRRGMLVRHLVLPGQISETKKILRYLHQTFGNHIYISILNQYTPMPRLSLPENLVSFSDINRSVTAEEYQRVLTFADAIGIEKGYIQEGDTVGESFIPPFTCEGL
ncbi:MAG: radical SAM protein [Roseburia sp.]|nr:radical SAM protein [Roseburia sp.]